EQLVVDLAGVRLVYVADGEDIGVAADGLGDRPAAAAGADAPGPRPGVGGFGVVGHRPAGGEEQAAGGQGGGRRQELAAAGRSGHGSASYSARALVRQMRISPQSFFGLPMKTR